MKTKTRQVIALLGIALVTLSCSSDGTKPTSLAPKTLPKTEETLPPDHPLRKAFADIPSSREQLEKFGNRVREQLDTTVALTWAKQIVGRKERIERISPENIPQTIKHLELHFPVFTSWGDEPGKLPLFVEWGGGFRHWGLVFADAEEALRGFRMLYQPVTNGLYTFVSTDR